MAEPASRDQFLRRERGQGKNIHFSCSADHEQDWQPYPVDPYSADCTDDILVACTKQGFFLHNTVTTGHEIYHSSSYYGRAYTHQFQLEVIISTIGYDRFTFPKFFTIQQAVYVYLYGQYFQQSMYQPGMVDNPLRGQLDRKIICFPVPVRA